ncbi:MAG: CheY-like chemotaxis protein [Candidatus Paceibacteria bacterium]|jgi:CheY-like chemotaxis protein
MSVLAGKHFLIVGSENLQIRNLKETLQSHGVIAYEMSCDELSPEKVHELNIDFIFLNYLDDSRNCKNLLSILRMTDFSKLIPSFILVDNVISRIEEVISYGATDYLTPEESTETTLQKIRTIFTEDNKFTGSSSIDITPMETSPTAKGTRVYVVEDDPLLRDLLSMKFVKSSFPFAFSKDGKQAIAHIKQFQPDVVILDLMLPGVDGFDLLFEIKNDPLVKDIPVIIFSNRDVSTDRQKAQEMGAAAFYVKAMTDLSELVKKIELLKK